MNTKAQTGAEGEEKAADYLISQGYKILERNYRHRRSEVDIVAEKNGILVFVEVKTKSYTAFGFPEESVNHIKVERVTEAADNYVHEIDWHNDIRFDVIAVDKSTNEIKHFTDAFY